MRTLRFFALLAGLVLSINQAHAALVTFIPPNDPTGSVQAINSNDQYSTGRGAVFTVTSNVTIDSIGIFQDLTNIDLNYQISQVNALSGDITVGQNVLLSGLVNANTAGLQWIDVSIAPFTFNAGSNYHIQFSFTGLSNQNFYYANNNIAFSVGDFASIDGTRGGNTANTLIPGIRVNTVSAVPEPSSLLAVVAGMGAMPVVRRRRR